MTDPKRAEHVGVHSVVDSCKAGFIAVTAMSSSEGTPKYTRCARTQSIIHEETPDVTCLQCSANQWRRYSSVQPAHLHAGQDECKCTSSTEHLLHTAACLRPGLSAGLLLWVLYNEPRAGQARWFRVSTCEAPYPLGLQNAAEAVPCIAVRVRRRGLQPAEVAY